MTDEEYARVRPVIDMANRLHMSLHSKLIERGVEPIDALLASTEANLTLATHLHGGNVVDAMGWMRDAIDTIERQLLDQVRH